MAQPDSDDTPTPRPSRRTLRFVMEAVIGLFVGLILLAAGTIFLLSSGPVSVSALSPVIERSLEEAIAPYTVHVHDTQIVWGGWDRAIDVVARDVELREPDNTPLAVLPEVSVALSFHALLQGDVRVKTLELLNPRLTLTRMADGAIRFAIATGSAAEPVVRPDTNIIAVPRPEKPGDLPNAVLDVIRDTLDRPSALGGIQKFRLVNAEVQMLDLGSAETLWLHKADLTAARADGELSARVTGTLETSSEAVPVGATLRANKSEQRIEMVASFGDMTTGLPIRYFPDLTFYLPDMTIAGSFGAVFDFSGRPERFEGNLNSAAGSIDLTVTPDADHGGALQAKADLKAVDVAVWLGGLYDARDVVDYLPRVTVTGQLSADMTETYQLKQAEGALTSTIGDLSLTVSPKGDGGFSGRLAFQNLLPDQIAQTSPNLGMLAGTTARLHGGIDFDLRDDLSLLTAKLDAEIGAGLLVLPDPHHAFPSLLGGRVVGSVDARTRTASLDSLDLNFGNPILHASAALQWTAEDLSVTASAGLTDMPMARLASFWPAGLADNPRAWVTENIPEADVKSANVTLALQMPGLDPDNLALQSLSGEIQFDKAVVHYRKPWLPVTNVAGKAEFDAKQFGIDIYSGTLNDATLKSGRIDITGLDIGSEIINIAVQVDTPMKTALTLLDSEPGRFITKLGLDPNGIDGQAEAEVRFRFPLLADLRVEDIIYEADAEIRKVTARKAGLEWPAHSDKLTLALKPGEMRIVGPVSVNGVDATADWQENFSDGAQETRRISLTSVTDLAKLAGFGLALDGYAGGRAGLALNYAAYTGGAQSLALSANLNEAWLRVDPVKWEKVPGTPSELKVQAVIAADGSIQIPSIILDGGQNHRLEASADLMGTLLHLQAAKIQRLSFGTTRVAGSIAYSDGAYEVDLRGPQFDATPLLQSDDEADAEPVLDKPPVTEPRLRLHGVFETITNGAENLISNADVMLHLNGEKVDLFTLGGDLADNKKLDVGYLPTGTGGHSLRIDAQDTGMALAVADITGRLEGGTLSLVGESAGPEAPMVGRIKIRNFVLREAPRLAKVLEALSVTGILSALGEKGVAFKSLDADYSMTDDRLDISNAVARGNSMGITLSGSLDRQSDQLDMKGEIAISDIFSKVIGVIPIIDQLIGEGLIGAAFTMTGSVDDPKVSVNPLSVLTPGFLRQVFNADAPEGATNSGDEEKGN